MGFADIHGRAHVDERNPDAFAECDECGEWYNRVSLKKQMEYSGTRLFWTGFLVCPRCISEPQPQFLTPILPGDPKPVIQPRPQPPPSTFVTPGWTLIEFPLVPQDSATVLATVAQLTGVPTPPSTVLLPTPILAAMKKQQVLAANPARTWLVAYNPNTTPIVVSTGNAAFSGDPGAVLLGAGQAMFALGPVPQGAITDIGYFAGVPLLIAESPSPSNTFPPIPVFAP